MKIIDLLVKLANGEEVPKQIKFEGEIFTFDKNYRRYIDEDNRLLGERTSLDAWLNDEVGIIEEPKEIEKIPIPEIECSENERILRAEIKINELIDVVKELKKEEK